VTPISIPYIVNSTALSGGLVPETINVLVDGDSGVWYIDNLWEHAGEFGKNSYYRPSEDGPSYLDRLEGKLVLQPKYSSQTTNTIGLESLVNKYKFWFNYSLSINKTKTNIDYIYLNNSIARQGDLVKGFDEIYLYLDNSGFPSPQEIYNVSDIA